MDETVNTVSAKSFPFVPISTELLDAPGMIQQVVQSNSKEGYVGFRVRLPLINAASIVQAIADGTVPALASFLEDAVAAKQREVLKRAHLNGASGVSDVDVDLAAIDAFIESNKTISISVALWNELFAPVGAVIASRVAEAKKLPDDMDQETVLRVADPTIRFWKERWNMCRKAGGVVSQEERVKLEELFSDAVAVSNGAIGVGVVNAATRLIRGVKAGADVLVDVVDI